MAYPMICPATFPTISQIAALVCETRWIVGDVPPSALQDKRGGREEAAHFTAAHVAHRQRRLGDPLANFEDAPALEAFIFVGRHPVEATWGGLIVSRRHGLWLILSALVLVAGCSNAKEAEKRAEVQKLQARAAYDRALSYLNDKQPAGALASLQEAININPSSPVYRDTLGVVLLELGRPDMALEHFKKAIELNPMYADAYFHLGTALAESRRWRSEERRVGKEWRAGGE